MARYEHLSIFRDAYDLTVHLEKIVRNFSRYHMYTLSCGGFMMRNKIRTHSWYTALLLGLILSLLAAGVALAAGNISATDKWAWGTNVGWINFNPDNGGVTVYNDHLEGYAWGENVGWIRLGTHTGGSPHTYGNTSNTDYGVNRDTTSGALSGFAWSTTAGWINFAPANGGVTVSDAGEFSGYAWGENIGWIKFNGTAADSTPYKVATTGPLAVTLAGFSAEAQAGHVLVAWETVSEIGNAGFNLYRSDDPAGPLTLLAHVPSQAPGSTQGAAYSYEDLNVSPGEIYWYWLEDVSLSGATTLHGPVSATVQTPTAVTLGSISASPAAAPALPWLLLAAGAGLALGLSRLIRRA